MLKLFDRQTDQVKSEIDKCIKTVEILKEKEETIKGLGQLTIATVIAGTF